MKNWFLVLFLVLVWLGDVSSQVVFEPVHKTVYGYLDILARKGVIIKNEFSSPLSRIEIAGFLASAGDSSHLLTSLEKEELDFYLNDFAEEINILQTKSVVTGTLGRTEFFQDDNQRYRLFSYSDNHTGIYLDPILGYSSTWQEGGHRIHRWNGVSVYGYLHNWGFSMNFRDNLESGDEVDKFKQFTPSRGIDLHLNREREIEYSLLNAAISYNWGWGDITIGKDYQLLGSGQRGKLILSDKAPSFPSIKLRVKPTDWLDFEYLHGWLHSLLIDSTTIHYGNANRFSFLDRNKFIASHAITVRPIEGLSISLGESIIYSDRLQISYLIPVMFFRLADHYLSDESYGDSLGSNSGANAQLFSELSLLLPSYKTKLYSTFFIDELSISAILKGTEGVAAFGFTIGLVKDDVIFQNNTIVLEYSRINPFVYMNSNPAHLYSSYGYSLGHWMGSNADNLFFSFSQRIIRGLVVGGWIERVRRGSKELPEQQYQLPYPEFLFGTVQTSVNYGFQVSYELVHDLKVVVEISSKESLPFTPALSNDLKRSSDFRLSFGYGL